MPCLNVLFQGERAGIVPNDGDTMSIKSTLTQTNSHAYKLTDMLVDEPPNIDSDSKNFLLVYPTEAFLVRAKNNGVYVSVYLRNTDTKFVGVSSGVLSLVNWEKVN